MSQEYDRMNPSALLFKSLPVWLLAQSGGYRKVRRLGIPPAIPHLVYPLIWESRRDGIQLFTMFKYTRTIKRRLTKNVSPTHDLGLKWISPNVVSKKTSPQNSKRHWVWWAESSRRQFPDPESGACFAYLYTIHLACSYSKTPLFGPLPRTKLQEK